MRPTFRPTAARATRTIRRPPWTGKTRTRGLPKTRVRTVEPRPRRSFQSACSALLLALLLGCGAIVAAAPVGEVTHVSGALVARKADGSSRILAPKSKVESGDLLVTAQDTYARVKFTDGGEVTLRPNTQLRVDEFAYDESNP